MTTPSLAPGDWLGVLAVEFATLAAGTLGLAPPVVGRLEESAPAGSCGAYLPLIGPACSYQIALVSNVEGCEAVARGLLGAGPETALTPAETADAVCEVVNILAGTVKARLRERVALQLGLPIFFNGPVQPTERMGVTSRELRAGPLNAALVLVHPRI